MDLFKLLGIISIDNKDAKKALDDTSTKGQQTESKLGKAFSTMGKGAAIAGKAIASGLAAGATAIGALTVKALNLSGELEQNMGGSEAVFGQFADKVQNKAKEAFSNMGLATSDYLATANKMGALFQGAGFSIEESMNLSSDAMQRAADVASIMGIDTASAMEAVAGAAKGNFTMMDNLGVAMNDTTLNAYALEKGIGKTTQEMTNQEKIGLAMELFMEKTAYAAGNYAKENETLAGSLGTAKAALTNFLDGSGDVEQLVSAFKNAADVIIKNVKDIAPRLISGLVEIVNQVVPIIPGLFQQILPVVLTGATSLIQGIVSMLPSLLNVLTSTVLPNLISALKQVISSIISILPSVLGALLTGLSSVLPMLITEIINLVGTVLLPQIPVLIQTIIDILPSLLENVITALMSNLPILVNGIFTLIEGLIPQIPVLLHTLLDAVFLFTEQWAGTLIQMLPSILSGLGKVIKALVQALPSLLSALAKMAFMNFLQIFIVICEIFEPLADWFKTKVIQPIANFFKGLWDNLKGIWDGICNVVKFAFDLIGSIVSAAFQIITLPFRFIWENCKESVFAAFEWIKGKIQLAINFIKNIVQVGFNFVKEKIINPIIAAKNKVVEVFNNIKSSIQEKITAVKNKVSEIFNGIKSKISDTVNNIRSKVTETFTKIRDAMTKPVQKAQSTIKGIVDKIKGFFSGLKLKFPNIKLPHFRISPSGWKIGDLLKGSIPKLGIEWYAKAMNNPMLMTSPTIFGYNPKTGNVMGGGENGSEIVSGTNTLMTMIGAVVEGKMAGMTEQMLSVLTAILNAIVTGNGEMLKALLDGHTIKIGEREFGRLVREYA